MNQLPDIAPVESAKIPASALPRSDADRLAWLQLARSRRVGPSTFIRLIRTHGTARAALDALPDVAAKAGARGYAPCSAQQAINEIEAAQQTQATMLCLGTPDYPPRLTLIPDPPPLLWAIGTPSLAARATVGLVGARNASSIGQRMAGVLAQELGQAGYIIASGLARGIDAAAHNASLDTGTIAVLAGGVDTIYPRENKALWHSIAEHGLLLSEAPIGCAPQARHFPKRNRIISGVSLGIVVIEGAAKSGSMITARDALDQGREVMAVPGSPLDPRAAGCNMLLRDGAVLVRSGADIIECLSGPAQPDLPLHIQTFMPPVTPPKTPNMRPNISPSNTIGQLQALLSTAPISEDSLIRAANIPAPDALRLICELELDGVVQRHPGGLISLAT